MQNFRRRLISSFTVLSLISPATSFAAETQTVTRGDFIRDVIKALDLPLSDSDDVPTERIAKPLLPYIATAQARGALGIFGTEIGTTMAITRGQAAYVLMKLQSLKSNVKTSKFADLQKDPVLAEAAQIAVDRQWMRPERPKSFGVNKLLTVREQKLLLKRLQKKTPVANPVDIDTGTTTIKVNFRPVDKSLPKNAILEEIWRILNDNYLYQEKIKPDEAAYGAAQGLVNSLKDPYTVFFPPASNKDFQNRISGEVTGIGAQVEQKNGVLVIVSPLKNSPAEKAGLLPGDEIIAADGVTLIGLDFTEAVGKVRGPQGSTVKLRIRRNGAELEYSVIRDKIIVPDFDISSQGKVTVVTLHQFGDITNRDLRLRLAEVQKAQPAGIILDLRNNPGGLLSAADIVLSNFLPKGTVVANIEAANSSTQEKTFDAPTIDPAVPMVVLVNKGSASAAEVVAGALQDYKRALIVGEQTFGKGTVQSIFQFREDGSSIKLTVAEWKTPLLRKIDGVGVVPDFTVPGTKGDRDEQMLKALELLR